MPRRIFSQRKATTRIVLTTPKQLKRYREAMRALESDERREKKRNELCEQTHHLLSSREPCGRVVALANIRRVTPENDHYGYWAHNAFKDGGWVLAECGSAMDKRTFTNGYATSYGGHHFGGGVWIGPDIEDVVDYLTATKALPAGDTLEQFKTDLKRLEASEVERVYFDHPRRTGIHPVYVVDPMYMNLLHDIGFVEATPTSWSDVPLHQNKAASYQYNRPTLLGDVIVVETDPRGDRYITYYIPGAEKEYYRYVL